MASLCKTVLPPVDYMGQLLVPGWWPLLSTVSWHRKLKVMSHSCGLKINGTLAVPLNKSFFLFWELGLLNWESSQKCEVTEGKYRFPKCVIECDGRKWGRSLILEPVYSIGNKKPHTIMVIDLGCRLHVGGQHTFLLDIASPRLSCPIQRTFSHSNELAYLSGAGYDMIRESQVTFPLLHLHVCKLCSGPMSG